MRVFLIIAVLLLVATSGAALVPLAQPIRPYQLEATLALAVLVLILVVLQPSQKVPPPGLAAKPTRPASGCADAEIVHFLAMLQEKGRLDRKSVV